MRPWQTLGRVETRDGPLELRRRGERDFLLTLSGRVLMTSSAHRSEVALAERAGGALAGCREPRVLLGGLGMGFTLRAALATLPEAARVVVAELHPEVICWVRGPLAPLSGSALDDPRVRVEVADVGALIRAAARRGGAARYDAIVLDLYAGPGGAGDPHFGDTALARTHTALRAGGIFAAWSEAPAAAFERRLAAARFDVERRRAGRGGRRHAVYLARAL